MTTEITMPQLGESITEGMVSRWLKRPGESVARYEALLEVVTDKVDSEVPSPTAGVLLEIVVPEGETVRVGTVLARIGEANTALSAVTAIADQYDVEPGTQETPPILLPSVLIPAPIKAAPGNGRTQRLTPVVARMVAEHGLDIARISGTGANGRVSKRDVEHYLRLEVRSQEAEVRRDELANVPSTPDQAAAPPLHRSNAPTLQRSNAPTLQRSNASTLDADTELVPLTPMRRSIAEHMVASLQAAPQVTNVFEVDLSRIVAHRAASKADFERQGVRLTYTAYFFQATAAALLAVPTLNGRYTESGIVLNRRVHIGMAVALEQGLIVPVIRDVNEKNLLGLARAVNDLAERARSRRLKPDEMQGGTFTITNHGTGGSLFGTPVINQPQSAILGIGAMVKRPVVLTLDGQDMIAIRPMSYLSLTFDHRLIDGSSADAFLTALKNALEHYV
jgi:2-oxoglutarate dehydrogenase E2 component (dihydrolipoamide succinyltransferase)